MDAGKADTLRLLLRMLLLLSDCAGKDTPALLLLRSDCAGKDTPALLLLLSDCEGKGERGDRSERTRTSKCLLVWWFFRYAECTNTIHGSSTELSPPASCFTSIIVLSRPATLGPEFSLLRENTAPSREEGGGGVTSHPQCRKNEGAGSAV